MARPSSLLSDRQPGVEHAFAPGRRDGLTCCSRGPDHRRHRRALVCRRHRRAQRQESWRSAGLEHSPAERVVDVTGLYVAPGFIDMMGQTGAPFLKNPRAADNLLTQGITTINAGEGDSDAPLDPTAGQAAGWQTMAEFFSALEKAGMPLNVVQTVGHTQVRRLVLGDVDRQASSAELERMKSLVREAMEAGAIGLSTALIYPPAVYASTDEIVALAQVAGEYGGSYFTHMRNEGDRLLEAIDEALTIGKRAGTPVHIFHLKAAGKANWPKMEQALALIKAARAGGQQVTADIYPYVNNGLGLEVVPPSSPRGAGGRRAAQEARRPRDPCRDAPRDGIDRRLGKLVQTCRVGLGQRHPEPDPARDYSARAGQIARPDRPRGRQGSVGRLLHDRGFRCECTPAQHVRGQRRQGAAL